MFCFRSRSCMCVRLHWKVSITYPASRKIKTIYSHILYTRVFFSLLGGPCSLYAFLTPSPAQMFASRVFGNKHKQWQNKNELYYVCYLLLLIIRAFGFQICAQPVVQYDYYVCRHVEQPSLCLYLAFCCVSLELLPRAFHNVCAWIHISHPAPNRKRKCKHGNNEINYYEWKFNLFLSYNSGSFKMNHFRINSSPPFRSP